jgi:NitT/TauT family transport system substrate-binding protein
MYGVRQLMGFLAPLLHFLIGMQPRYTSPCKGEVDRRSGATGGRVGVPICARSITFDPHPARFARRPPPCRGRYTETVACARRNPACCANLFAAALAALVASPAAAQTGIKFTLGGPIEGPEALFLVPHDRGYFKATGLDVVVDDAVSPLDPLNRVASGGYELGFADLNALIRYRDQHPSAPLKAIFMVYNKPAYAVVARKSRGITEPKQLEHKKIGAPAAGSTFAQWPLFAKLNNIDASKVTIENIAIPVRAPMLAAGQIDAALGSSFRLYVDLKERGVPIDDIVLMPMANYGMKLYGNAIVANSKFATEKPELVKAFLHAFTRGLKETIRRPTEAVDSILKRDDAARREVELERLRMAVRENILTPEVRVDGLGAIELARLEQSMEQIALVYMFKAKPKPEEIFDASFLPPLSERKVN